VAISVFDLFTVGIGPSSSHTVGPMRAARTFAVGLREDGLLGRTHRIRVELFGSLGATGRGHGTDRAVILGLFGERPETVDPRSVADTVAAARATGMLAVLGQHPVTLGKDDLVFNRRVTLPFHPNGMRCQALGADASILSERTYYSVGGGFVVDEAASGADRIKLDDTPLRFPFTTGDALMEVCALEGLPVSSVMLANELSWRTEAEIRARLL
jgi:L-serine dehydratase